MSRTVLRTLTFALAAAAFALVLGTLAPTTPAQAPVLPDLVADPVERVAVEEQVVEGVNRRIVRFDGFIHNAGAARLLVEGSGPTNRAMTQITQEGVGVMPASTTVKYENTDGHNHWHLGNAAAYSLHRDTLARELAAPAQKVGFCLLDGEYISGPDEGGEYLAHECRTGEPQVASVTMILSEGWRDIYARNVWLQWVDISDVQPGPYRLAARMDPGNVVRESNETNNLSTKAADPAVTIEGWRATGSTVTSLPRDAASTITLGAQKFDDAALPAVVGPAEYKIVSGPAHGTIDRPVGTWSPSNSVKYTPAAGAPLDGQDEITFAVREKDAVFPENPATAKVAIQLESLPALEITGAPASGQMEVGTTVNLDTNLDGVTWSVVGGGSITQQGVYTAPSSPGGPHTIRARLADGRSAEVAITVVAKPPPVPLVIEGPASLRTREATKLTVADGPPDTWAASAGTIDSTGTYTAPTAPVQDVVITATRGSRTGTLTLDVVAPPAVAISGAPAELIEGTTASLTASQPNATWASDRGTISPAGVFTAPADGGGTTATITATTPFGATDTVKIRIVDPKPVVPIPGGDEDLLQPVTPPSPGEPIDVLEPPPFTEPKPKPKPRRKPVIDRLSARRSGPYVVVSLRPGRTGRLRVSLIRGQRWLRSCRTKVRAGRPISCRLKTSTARRGLRIVATLDPAGRAKPVVRRKAVVTADGHRHRHS